ncbi:cyclase family protein [Alteribacillus bidgolensis]|uniref:Kynurenine formamidase n=1 Tax=Alteribacillus bidgolensis TaxID=930129 RepID=A0A1G8RFT4_9BACI|nr:cyclase family protein [Alteribacillus bidgolensis]SDJ15867.1 Kynurenine formamidase [Alteribacillus bidgolensis]
MEIYDISAPIYQGMPVYKNKEEKQPVFERTTSGHVTETRVTMDCHSGTHVDAPLHMVPNGNTIESISLEDLVVPCKVLDVSHVDDGIVKEDLTHFSIEKDDFILLKTKNSEYEDFKFDFIYLKADAAEYLSSLQIKGVGIDALGIERSQKDHSTHRALFKNNVIIVEGLRLKNVPEGEYKLVTAPLKIIGTDAAPARVFLMK